MKFRDILSKITKFTDSPIGSIITSVVPGLGVVDDVLATVNTFTGEKLTEESTVGELEAAVSQLSDEQLASLQEKEFELKIIESNNYAAVAMQQESNNNATRPQIALEFTHFFIEMARASFLFLVCCMIGDIILLSSSDGKEAIFLDIGLKGMPWLAGVYAVPAMSVIQEYFAKRSEDKRTAAATTGVKIPEGRPEGIISAVMGMIRK